MNRLKNAVVITLALAVTSLALWKQLGRNPPVVEIRIDGQIFGSTYSLVTYGTNKTPRSKLKELVEQRLHEIDSSMSTWDKTSELTRINQGPILQPLPISSDLSVVLREAMRLSEMTDGIYDVTVGPLVKLWGFGPTGPRPEPSATEVQDAKAKVGFRNLKYTNSSVTKTKEGMSIDLSSKAPGYAADQVGALLAKIGFTNYLVEVGGEVVVKGKSPNGGLWSIGIETPTDNVETNSTLFGVMQVESGAVSTSGTYHRFRTTGKRKTHHIIDPRTGEPADSGVVSVTVTAPTCTEADGLGTALLIMGEERGLAWIAAHPRYQALFLVKTANGFAQRMSPGFEKFLVQK